MRLHNYKGGYWNRGGAEMYYIKGMDSAIINIEGAALCKSGGGGSSLYQSVGSIFHSMHANHREI